MTDTTAHLASFSAPISATASPEEVARFTAMAESWWDPDGKFKPLHRFNPIRLAYMRRILCEHLNRDSQSMAPFAGIALLDIGCGGGLLSEPLCRMGFDVTGIDAGERNIAVARLHAEQTGLSIDYRVGGPESLGGQLFDVVICMEVIEHVPDPQGFVALAVERLKPGGIFIGATLNRTAKAYALAILGAEYVMGWLPKGTHDWKKFVRPAEFAAWLRAAHMEVCDLTGASYDLLADQWHESKSLDVNYMIVAVKS
jgi:2-polyprenyl-6-hydroxyphenyl methylase / 3-demethylubiquinone-9 3-methyltransferase